MDNSLIVSVLDKLREGVTPDVFVGFDGFVDEIIHVVEQRQSAREFTRVETISDFAAKAASFAGLSGNMELVTLEAKLGGNGPIMANALISQGYPTTYVGAIGSGEIHPLFAEFASRCKHVISVSEPAHTDALEFLDGKLMFGKVTQMFSLNWGLIMSRIREEELKEMIREVRLFAFTNWTMIPDMNGIIRQMGRILEDAGNKPYVFFDLADPTKRTDGDLRLLFEEIALLNKSARVILGMNLNESRIISRLCHVTSADTRELAAGIRSALDLYAAVIHPTHGAAAATAQESCWVDGPYTESPKLTTGAGDNFNAGFCSGIIQGLNLQQCLLLGVSTSGYYVREAHSPNREELVDFISTWKCI